MIVVVIPFHDADRLAAIELVELIAAIEPARREDVRVRLVNRYDADNLPLATIQSIGKKFDVSWGITKSKETGWPAGPNAMTIEIIEGAPKWLEAAGWPGANGVLIMEPDCVPLRRDWLDVLIREWDIHRPAGAWQMGAWSNSGGVWGHINGNSLIRPDLGKKVDLRTWCPKDLAWDVGIAPFVRKNWARIPYIINHYKATGAKEEDLRLSDGQLAAFVHGYKDGSARALARKLMNL